MRRIRLSPRAEEDLSEIWFYIAQDDIEAADRLVSLVYEKCQLLSEAPLMGIERPELAVAIRSFPAGNYIIFYRVADDGIEVARVLNGRRDVPSIISD